MCISLWITVREDNKVTHAMIAYEGFGLAMTGRLLIEYTIKNIWKEQLAHKLGRVGLGVRTWKTSANAAAANLKLCVQYRFQHHRAGGLTYKTDVGVNNIAWARQRELPERILGPQPLLSLRGYRSTKNLSIYLMSIWISMTRWIKVRTKGRRGRLHIYKQSTCWSEQAEFSHSVTKG